MTARAIVLGALLGVVFAAAGMYVGSLTGVVDAGNIAAAMIGFAVLGLSARRESRTAETVIVQTVSSSAAYMSISGGFLGPVTALALLGKPVSLVWVALWGTAIAVLGCLVAIPLHRRLVTDEKLPFPTARATAEVIDAVAASSAHARARVRTLLVATSAAAAIVVLRDALKWLPAETAIPIEIGAIPAAAIGLNITWSPLLFALGPLFGVRLAISLALGSLVAWIVIGPWVVAEKIATADYANLVGWLMWPGVGLMLGGAFAGVLAGMQRLRTELKLRARADAVETGAAEISLARPHVIAIVVACVAIVAIGVVAFHVHPLVTAGAILLSVIVCSAAGRATGETDITPAGPLGGLGQIALGAAAPGGVVSPLTAGGVVNGVVMHSSTQLLNWRIGRLVKTSPAQQLVAQLIGVVVGSVACVLVFELLRQHYGFGSEAVPAPTGLSWKATAEVVQHGVSTMPRHAPLAAALGLGIGSVLAIAGRHPKLQWLPSPFAFGVAFIVPPYIAIAILAGALIAKAIEARVPRAAGEMITIVSGLIAGEAIVGLLVVMVKYVF